MTSKWHGLSLAGFAACGTSMVGEACCRVEADAER